VGATRRLSLAQADHPACARCRTDSLAGSSPVRNVALQKCKWRPRVFLQVSHSPHKVGSKSSLPNACHPRRAKAGRTQLVPWATQLGGAVDVTTDGALQLLLLEGAGRDNTRDISRLCRYKFGGTCWKCAPDSVIVALFVILGVGGVGLVALYLWKTMEDPRIGSPFNLMLGMLETLAILRLTSIQWPESVARMLTMVSLVNFNVEVFQTQCLLGPPQPITGALSYMGSLFGATVVAALLWPLLQLSKRVFPIQSAEFDGQSLEGACYSLRPDRSTPNLYAPFEFTPTQCLRRASFNQYVQIAGTVRPFDALLMPVTMRCERV
jgi:hypothetical protein